jgi:hypothetical protein
MPKTFIDQLFIFLGTPGGIIGIAIGILMVIKATHSRPTAWFLFSLCCFASSLNTFVDRWNPIPPALAFPLQQIRTYGRPLAIVLLILLVFLALQTQNNWRRWIFPQAIKYLMFVQFVIFFKTLVFGNIEFALLSGITFGGIVFMLKMGPGRWLQNDENFHMAVRSIAVAGVIFVVGNSYQYYINPFPVSFIQNRFMGTTGNPQHAAVLLAATIPCLMFMLQSIPRWNYIKALWVLVLVVVMYFLVQTGSRTGLLMGAISILLFYRQNGGAWLRIALFVAISGALLLLFADLDTVNSSSGINSSVSARFSSGENTREAVWNALWGSFMRDPLFGAPLRADRMGYGENSWLSAGANLGLVGFIPMMMVGWESLKLMQELYRLSNRNSYYFFQSSTVIAGLGSMIVGACFEAFLLGNITFSLIAFLTYLLMGAYLVEVDRVRTRQARAEAEAEAEYEEQQGVYQ